MCSGLRSSSANGAIALRHASACSWSTSRSSVLSDWTIRGPSVISERVYGGRGERPLDGSLHVQPGGREGRHIDVLGTDQHLDLGAAEDDALGTLLDEPADDLDVRRPRLLADHAEAQLVVDHPVDELLVLRGGDEHGEPV